MQKCEYKHFKDFYNRFRCATTNHERVKIYGDIIRSVEKKKEIDLINSFINKPFSSKIIELDDFLKYIITLNNIKYKPDADELKEKIIQETEDISQINTILRIIKNKPVPDVTDQHQVEATPSIISIIKKCPHCTKEYHGDNTLTYVICGYEGQTGYDWNGCGKDWCFSCGKLLCKKWDTHSLFTDTNRKHDNKCCHRHARKTNRNYTTDYCMCVNKFVHR